MSDLSESPIDIVGRLGRSALAKRIVEIVEQYEAEMTNRTGQTYVAVRTRQSLLRNGAVGAVVRAIEGKPTTGFKRFVGTKPQKTYEWLALEFPHLFAKTTRDAARRRLEYFGVENIPGQKREVRLN